jgi:ketosteroid isomerase-like protein
VTDADGEGGGRRAANVATMRAHFAHRDEPNPDAVLEQIADEFSFDLPFAPELGSFDRAGYEMIIRHNAATYERHSVTVLEELPTVDPDVVVVRYDGDSAWAGGVPYASPYVAIYRFRAGKICAITEFHNPTVLAAARAATSALTEPR